MIINIKTNLLFLNSVLFLNINNIYVKINHLNVLNNDNLDIDLNKEQKWWIYLKSYINKKQLIEHEVFVFYDYSILELFIYLIGLDGFGFKTANYICNKNPFQFIEYKNKHNIEKLKNEYSLNEKQLTSLIGNKNLLKTNKKVNDTINILCNLGYSKLLVQKIINKNLNLINEDDYSVLIKKFVELINNEIK